MARPRSLVGNRSASKRRRDHAVAGLADSQKSAPEKHVIEIAGQCRPDRRETPEADAAENQELAIVPVTQPARERRDRGIHDHERRPQPTEPVIVDIQIFLNRRADREECIAVHVVQCVHHEQDREREILAVDRGELRRPRGRHHHRLRRRRLHQQLASCKKILMLE